MGLISGACWLGGVNVRAIVGFWLLEFGSLEFRPNIHPLVERTVFSLLAQSSLLVHGAYGLLLASVVFYLIRARRELRQRAWMVFAAILFLLFVPVEVYSMVLDLRMWRLDASGSNDLVEYRKLFIHRLGALSGVPMIALLCYYTAAAALVFRPPFGAGKSVDRTGDIDAATGQPPGGNG